MSRIVIRPRIQIPILVVIFTVWTLLGATYFTSGDVVAEHDWFGIVLGCALVTSGVAGIWRAVRLGVVIDAEGVRIRGFDSRDQVTPWSAIQSVDCVQIDARGGLPLYAPVYWCHDRSPARLGRGDRRVALTAAAHRSSGVALIWRASVGHRGGERLKSGVCPARRSVALLADIGSVWWRRTAWEQ